MANIMIPKPGILMADDNPKPKTPFNPFMARQDRRPVAMKLFDRENRQVGEIMLPPPLIGETPRVIIWQGRPFKEGDGSGFYGPGEFAEMPHE